MQIRIIPVVPPRLASVMFLQYRVAPGGPAASGGKRVTVQAFGPQPATAAARQDRRTDRLSHTADETSDPQHAGDAADAYRAVAPAGEEFEANTRTSQSQ